MRYWMICYDISDNTRRREIAENLADAGASRVQESVFEGYFLQREMVGLMAQLSRMLDGAAGDNLRAYPLSPASQARLTLGAMPAKPELTGYWLC